MSSSNKSPRAVTALLSELWRDERAYVHSAELILISTIAIIGLLVGLAAYRDALVSELDDTGKAIGSINQSYNVTVTGSSGPPSDVVVSFSGTTVSVTATYPLLTSTATFANFSYADQTDYCDTSTITFPSTAILDEGDTFPP